MELKYFAKLKSETSIQNVLFLDFDQLYRKWVFSIKKAASKMEQVFFVKSVILYWVLKNRNYMLINK